MSDNTYNSYNPGTEEEDGDLTVTASAADFSGPIYLAPVTEAEITELKRKHGKVYLLELDLTPEDDEDDSELTIALVFKNPTAVSFTRYTKSMSQNMLKASKTFALDNIVKEHEARFLEALEEYPALPMSVADKLMQRLGLAKNSNFTKL